jgi:hypothetical protein
VLDVAQLQTLLAKTFNLGLDVGRGKEPLALVRLRLAKALVGVAEANALAAESIASERGVSTEQIADAEALALHAVGVQRDARPRVPPHRPRNGDHHRPGRDRTRPTRTQQRRPPRRRAPGRDRPATTAPIPARLRHRRQRHQARNGHRTAAQRASRSPRPPPPSPACSIELAKITAAAGRTGKPDLN